MSTATKRRTVAELEAAVGGLSKPSKMPGLSYGLPAQECRVGSILRNVKGSTCASCYAHKGAYGWRTVKAAQARRLRIVRYDLSQWEADMSELLLRKYAPRWTRDEASGIGLGEDGAESVFRWHDSGDLQSRAHLVAIVAIARALPRVAFWLPTREYAIVRAHVREVGPFPENLTVRVSAPMVGEAPAPIPGTVSSGVDLPEASQCPAQHQGNECGSCRACWSSDVSVVSYPLH